MNELIFLVEEASEGGYTARAQFAEPRGRNQRDEAALIETLECQCLGQLRQPRRRG